MITLFSLQIDHQQQIQQQLIQNMLTYSQNDPQLMAKLLALLQDKDTENETVRFVFVLQFETLQKIILNFYTCILWHVCVFVTSSSMHMVAFGTFLC